MKKYGYVRVSSKDQNVDRQVEALKKFDIDVKDMFIDKQSGKDFNREAYKSLIEQIKEGDELYVKSVDRLGRDYEEIINQWRYLTKVKNVDIIVTDFPLLDTRTKINGLTAKFIADMVLQVMSYVAQTERENIKQRQAEGIRIAKEKGVIFGRPRSKMPDNFKEIFLLYKEKEISKRQGAKLCNTNHNTFSRWIERYTKEQ